MGKATNTTLSFRVSAGLKNVIGRDLISDKYIAVFELVKNSYDAGASKVRLSYRIQENGRGRLIVSDNGSGMTYEDIIQKWLFVAYSDKKPQNRPKTSYRDEIRREAAGATGRLTRQRTRPISRPLPNSELVQPLPAPAGATH